MRNKTFKTLAVLSALALGAAGCTKGGSSGGGGSGATGPNIYGVVTQSTTTKPFAGKPGSGKVTTFAGEAGCTVTAYDVSTGTAAGSVTSNSDGTYTITGSVVSGTTYKVVAACNGTSFTVVAKADSTEPTEKTSSPVLTNPVSTIIAAKIVTAILKAVEDATTGLDASIATAIKTLLYSNLDSIVAAITETVNTAIESGAMTAPTPTQASTISDGLASATTSAQAGAADDTYEAASPIPASVDQAVSGATNNLVAFADCDNTVPGKTALTCTKAIAKFMYSALNFPVMVLKSGGAFGTVTTCSTDLATDFPNAAFVDGSADGADQIPTGYCGIKPMISDIDRNRGDERGGDSKGPLFGETGAMDSTVAGDETGVLTAIGYALFNKQKYLISDIDKLVFGYNSSTKAGMNMRAFGVDFTAGGQGYSMASKYMDSTGTWSAVTDGFWSTNGGGFGGGVAWDPADAFAWVASSGNAFETLINGIRGGDFTTMGIFMKKFGGPVPAQAQLDEHIDNEMTHIEHNPSGQKEFYAIYSEATKNNNDDGTPNSYCWDNDPATVCKGVSGTNYPVKRVNLTIGNTLTSLKTRKITTLTGSSTGTHLMRPFYSNTGFSGVIGFTKIADGTTARDELMNERGIKVVLKSAECDGTKLPTGGNGCSVGNVYDVRVDWSSCNNGANCPSYYAVDEVAGGALNATAVTLSSLTIDIKTEYKQKWVNNGGYGYSYIATGDWNNMSGLEVQVTAAAGAADTVADWTSGTKYYLAQHWNCAGNPVVCTIDGFFLVDSNGVPYTDSSVGSDAVLSVWNGTTNVSTPKYVDNVVVSGTSNLAGVTLTNAINYYIPNGPYPNPNFKCEKEPYYYDANGNGKLDCVADPDTTNYPNRTLATGGSLGTAGDVSFGGWWEFQDWKNKGSWDNSLSTAEKNLRAGVTAAQMNQNGWVYGDPVGTKKLLTTAFNGWFDGAHTIATTTQFDALQTFALVFLFFEGSNDGRHHIDGLGGSTSNVYRVESRAFSGNDSTGGINHLIGRAILDFHQ